MGSNQLGFDQAWITARVMSGYRVWIIVWIIARVMSNDRRAVISYFDLLADVDVVPVSSDCTAVPDGYAVSPTFRGGIPSFASDADTVPDAFPDDSLQWWADIYHGLDRRSVPRPHESSDDE